MKGGDETFYSQRHLSAIEDPSGDFTAIFLVFATTDSHRP